MDSDVFIEKYFRPNLKSIINFYLIFVPFLVNKVDNKFISLAYYLQRQILMKITSPQKGGVRKISLQLNSNIQSRSTFLGQSRLSMSYSTNLKKRTDALYAQRAGLDQYVLKSEASKQKQKVITQNKSAFVYQKRIRQYKPITASKATRQIGTPELVKNLQTIQINAKSMFLKQKQRYEKETQRKNDFAPNYVTNSSMFKDISSTLRDSKQEYCLQTCPNFKDSPPSQIYFNNSSKISILTNQEQMQNKVNKNQLINSVSLACKSIIADSGRNQHNLSQKNRLDTNHAQSKLKKSLLHQHKEMYKTNNINLSEHFKNYDDRSSVFPTCRKMNISNVNKLYQLCIEEIKNIDLQKKHTKQQQNQKNQKNGIDQQQLKNSIQTIKNNLSQKSYKKYQRIESATLPGKIHRNQKWNKNEKDKVLQKSKTIDKNSRKNARVSGDSKNYRNQVEESRVWLQIKNHVDDEQELGYSLCTKKQIIDRASLGDIQKRHNIYRNPICFKKSNTEVYNYEDNDGNNYIQIGNPITAMKLSKMKTINATKNPQKMYFKGEQAFIAAWETSNQPNQINILEEDNF